MGGRSPLVRRPWILCPRNLRRLVAPWSVVREPGRSVDRSLDGQADGRLGGGGSSARWIQGRDV